MKNGSKEERASLKAQITKLGESVQASLAEQKKASTAAPAEGAKASTPVPAAEGATVGVTAPAAAEGAAST